ncbi:hypothetical protein HDF16_002133 [Granulicella aggregans]|uniref:Uncharacterized protein n=1 Tax=Granulicella aggregans TaxID=474949 RepID=A0A7W7ZCR5_9BACT|nr:hypothetical protein [Granulicella aggregans]MBB5057427.1 hypothetical protein [Granulicella aggregans]
MTEIAQFAQDDLVVLTPLLPFAKELAHKAPTPRLPRLARSFSDG